MLKQHSRSAALAALAMAAMAGPFVTSTSTTQASGATAAESGKGAQPSGKAMGLKDAAKRQLERAFLGGFGVSSSRRRFPGQGWSVAQDRRMAKKQRNRARNRRAQRG